MSDGGSTYTFKLDENALWHDGLPVTAEDVIFSLHSILDNKSDVDSSGNQPLAQQGRGAMVIRLKAYANWKGCCRAINESTVEVKLKFPAAAFLPTLALSTMHIMARHTVLDEGKIQTFETPEEFNGSGPYKLTSVVRNISNEYVKNDTYWKPGFPRFDGIKHFVIVDGAATVAAFKSGQVLMDNSASHNMSIRQQQQLAEDMKGTLRFEYAGPSALQGVSMNTKAKPFDDVRVRRAINLAIYRQEFNAALGEGIHLLGTPFPPGFWFSRSLEEAAQLPGFRELDGEKHPDDIAEAKRLLAAAGVTPGTELELSAINQADGPRIARILADQLNRFLGLDVTLRVMEPPAALSAYFAGDVQFTVQESFYNLSDPDAVYQPVHTRFIGGRDDRRGNGYI